MRVFVDTSALLALLVPTDRRHADAKRRFAALGAARAGLVTTSYVLLETYALLGRRMGRDAVRQFREGFAPLLEVRWVDSDLHERALDLLLKEARRRLSLVDAASLVALREMKVDDVFAFDAHLEG
jgi:predicted nucleic acid-binding protein